GAQVGPVRVPIVPAAILFDLFTGDPRIRPDAAAGHAACQSASRDVPGEGNVGAGAGAVVGKMFGVARAMRGGIGTASVCVDGITVGAIVAVNADGDTVFALATGASGRTAGVTLLGTMAAEATARAVLRAVWTADALSGPGLP